ncbi:MAG TPA: VWA domain-containing protein [Vicinamibacterales bacterium]|nr:VWA domain-containing protein [Vicinamibacterales bacterium]
MKLRSPLLLVLILALLAPLGAATEPVRISTIVTDRQGKAVTGLTLKDFEIREDGVLQPLLSVESRKPAPRRLAILLDEFHVDAADSVRIRDAVIRFITAQMRPDDTAVILKPLDPLTTIRLTSDRDALVAAVSTFEGRKGNFEPRSALEEETIGRAPALAEAGRAQVVLSGLRALATQLGSSPGRSAILLVSEGFTRQPRRLTVRGLPDATTVERFANRYDVPIYAFDPRTAAGEDAAGVAMLGRFVAETGGTLARGDDLAGNLARAGQEIDSGYTLTYQPSRADDGRYHPVRVTVVRREADARSRGGYVSAPSAEARRAMREGPGANVILPTRLLRRSPLIDVWSGVTRVSTSDGRVMVTWEPGRALTAAGRATASRVALKATTRDGQVLYEGLLAPVRVGEAADKNASDRAEFDAPSGRVQLDMTVLGMRGEKLDVDARDVEVPALSGSSPLLLPAILIATQSAREFRAVADDANAAPDPSRQFRRTERLVIRVPAYSGDAPVPVTAYLLNRLAQPMREIGVLPGAGGAGVTQFDLPLAPLAPGEYFLQFNVKGPGAPVGQRIQFRITG